MVVLFASSRNKKETCCCPHIAGTAVVVVVVVVPLSFMLNPIFVFEFCHFIFVGSVLLCSQPAIFFSFVLIAI